MTVRQYNELQRQADVVTVKVNTADLKKAELFNSLSVEPSALNKTKLPVSVMGTASL